MNLKPEQAKISAYYNLDNGTGKIRGIFTQGNRSGGEIFRSWLAPLPIWGANGGVTNSSTGSTDHMSFDAVGIPGFQFIQDPIEYETRNAPQQYGYLRSPQHRRPEAGCHRDRRLYVQYSAAKRHAAPANRFRHRQNSCSISISRSDAFDVVIVFFRQPRGNDGF